MTNRAVINPGATPLHQLPVYTLHNLKGPPTQWKLSPRQTKRYTHALDHLHDGPRFASVLTERATFKTSRRLHRANAHAADMLGITGVVTHGLIATRLRLVTMHHCPEVVEAL